MKPIADVNEAIAAIRHFDGPPEEFALPISKTLFDAIGMNMALITDQVLARNWDPDGYEQKDVYRIYRFKSMP